MELVFAIFLCLCGSSVLSQRPIWYEHAVIYEIFPRSFQDSNGDGIGDLKGIESRVDYLGDISLYDGVGIDAVWMTPIFQSPMADFGYDISDYYQIDPIFGTVDDFSDLAAALHEKQIKVILDFVPNHTSDQHDWFRMSINRTDPYTDYYVWEDPSGFDGETPLPPNNWISVFRFSAWEYNEQRGQFYLHQFTKEQPDLNHRNPAVMEEMKNVLRYWIDLGADGFRVDAAAFMVEDEQLRDEPLSNDPDATSDDYNYLMHNYTYNQAESRTVLSELYNEVKTYAFTEDGDDRLVFLDVVLPFEEEVKYYECSDFPLNLDFMYSLQAPVQASEVASIIDEWTSTRVPDGKPSNWVTGNHDVWRVADRFGANLINAFNMITLTLPGVTFTYQGEEIGMLSNFDISYEDTMDPAGCNCGPVDYNNKECSRDPERTPVQWNGQENAGFTNPGVDPWLPINSNYVDLNVELQKIDVNSVFSIYQGMMNARATDIDQTFKLGTTKTVVEGQILAIGRYQPDVFKATFITVVNFGDTEASIDLYGQFHPTYSTANVEVSSTGMLGNHPTGSLVPIYDISLQPSEALLLKPIDF